MKIQVVSSTIKCILVISFSLFVFVSCKKNSVITSNATSPVGTPPASGNKFPVAIAGHDTTVSYDLQRNTNQIELNGTNSFDPDGSIVSYSWSGPGIIINPDSAITYVSNLGPGIYEFRLTVKDNKGLTTADLKNVTIVLKNVTVVSEINRPVINVQMLPFGSLSQVREGINVASAGNKIVFAGGFIRGGGPGSGATSRIDIYDINTNSWSTTELSAARYNMAVVSAGNKIFFAGGTEDGWWDYGSIYSNVDIYDAAANTWSVAHLSEARGWLTASAVGNKIFFAGGTNNNRVHTSRVDIYDVNTNSWSTASLSESRSVLSSETVNNKIYFAGGLRGDGVFNAISATVDIYDNNTGSWSVSSMSEPKFDLKSISVGDKIFWAGGATGTGTGSHQSDKVQIIDATTQNSVSGSLFQPNSWDSHEQKAVVKDNKIIFFTGSSGNMFDIYDITTGAWTIGKLNQNNISGASVIAVNNTVYVAGGYVNGVLSNQVWKLEF